MMIDKIGGISPNYGTRKSEPVQAKGGQIRSDNVQISQEAAQAAELASTIKLVKSSEDPARMEKLKNIKEKLSRGDYDQLSDDQLNNIAESITSSFIGHA